MIPVAFTSWLAPYLRAFVALKRAGGCDYRSEEKMLLRFDRHLRREVSPPLSRSSLLAYMAAKHSLALRSRNNVAAVIWPALEYAKRHGARVLDLPSRPPRPPADHRQRQPRVLDDAAFGSLVSAAAQLPPAGSYRPVTVATLICLLWTTGLRIGEALALDVGDIDVRDDLLTVRAGKFGKSRVLPLRKSTIVALDSYLHHPLRPAPASTSAPLFISLRRRRLCHGSVQHSFAQAWATASLAGPRPRVHDLRHAFAVHRVAAWYAAGEDVNAWLPALSTYLGHVSVENTWIYLVANGALLQAACDRFELGSAALDEVQP